MTPTVEEVLSSQYDKHFPEVIVLNNNIFNAKKHDLEYHTLLGILAKLGFLHKFLHYSH